MAQTLFHGRQAHRIENSDLAVVVSVEGGHIAAIVDKPSRINPLWVPPWPSIEPSRYTAAKHPEYGEGAEAKLLCGILGHNLCLDYFGPPSAEEAAAGLATHGEASVLPYQIVSKVDALRAELTLPQARIHFTRELRLDGRKLHFVETVENLSALDRPIGWTQHVTLGPPFLENGVTEFRAPSVKSEDFAMGHVELARFSNAAASGGFSTHLMDPAREQAWFVAFSPHHKLALGYAWKRKDFPWLGTWEENRSRKHAPWLGRALTRGMEFGVSPFPETRREMVTRGSLFGEPGYRWLPARAKLRAEYFAFLVPAERADLAIPV